MKALSLHLLLLVLVISACEAADAQEWRTTGEPLVKSLDAAAFREGARPLIFESWPEIIFLSHVHGKSEITELTVPLNMKYIAAPAANANFMEVLHHISVQHGGVTQIEDSNTSTVFVVRNELLENPSWPPNCAFREASTATLTLAQAKELPHSQYGMNLGPKEKFLGLTGNESETIVWDASTNRKLQHPALVRDLLASIVIKFYNPNLIARVIALSVNGDNRAAEACNAKSFTWSLAYTGRTKQ